MSTQAQLLANRENAQRSTGPRSAEGKSRSAANSTRHGLSGCFAVLNHESLEEFQQLQADYKEQFKDALTRLKEMYGFTGGSTRPRRARFASTSKRAMIASYSRAIAADQR